MDKYLITMTICVRVEPHEIQNATTRAWEGKHALVVLGTKGSRNTFFRKDQVGKYTHDQWRKASELGLVYLQKLEGAELSAFAPSVDESTGLPQLMEGYEHAFAMRSKEGVAEKKPATVQAALPLQA